MQKSIFGQFNVDKAFENSQWRETVPMQIVFTEVIMEKQSNHLFRPLCFVTKANSLG